MTISTGRPAAAGKSGNGNPFLRTLLLYAGVAAAGTAIITLNNRYVNGMAWVDLLRFNLEAKLFLAVLFVIVFQAVTLARLHSLRTRGGTAGKAAGPATANRLAAFPQEMFGGMLLYGAIASPAYHLAAMARSGLPFHWSGKDGLFLLRDLLFEQSLSLILAVAIYHGLRAAFRPALAEISLADGDPFPIRHSLIRPLLVTGFAAMAFCGFSLMWYLLNTVVAGRETDPTVFGLLAAAASLVAFALFAQYAGGIRRDVDGTIRALQSLIDGERSRLYNKMPVRSSDEIGELALAFNLLQDKREARIGAFREELAMARSIQQNLLPQPERKAGPFEIAAYCRPSLEVGGDFFDIIPLPDGRWVVCIGDVTGKGMPAALIMSALMVGIRAEVRREGTAAEWLARLNGSLIETLRGSGMVTLGLALLDPRSRTIAYVSAGHLSPYLVRGDGAVGEIAVSSLPLGIDMDAEYRAVRIDLDEGERLVLYSDGIVETFSEEGNMFGFARWERELGGWTRAGSLKEQLDGLVGRLPAAATAEDDRTVVAIARPAAGGNETKRRL